MHGQFDGSPDDQRDGFIHLSLGSQLAGTLVRHYAQTTDLLVLEIDTDNLGAALRLEASRSGALFPHLYAPLPMTACTPIAWRQQADGEWQPLKLS